MESQGVIFKVLPAVSGQSQRTGNPWMAQSFVLEVSQGDHGQYKRKQVFEIFGEDRIKEANLSEGLSVKVYFDLEAREHEGKWYNSARAWKVEQAFPSQGQPTGQRPAQQYRQQPQQQYRQQPQQNVGYFQPTGQYPPQGGYYQQQPQQQFPPQQPQQFPPQQGGYPPQGVQEDLPF